jgi:hypothetical protein
MIVISQLKNGCRLGLLLGLLGALSACRTLDYRQIQSEFQEAVQADNSGASFTRQHEDVIERLTPEAIAQLDPKLRPNAWMLRAVSAWRAGLTNDLAEKSARSGLAEPTLVPGSRDQVVLSMIPSLAVDSDLLRRWLAADRILTPTEYDQVYEKGFRAACRQLTEASAVMNERTPVDARAYFHYQRWRIMQNWAAVIGNLKPVETAAAANQRSKEFLQNDGGLLAAANQDRDQIPPDHPLRALIRAKGGG